MFKIRGKVSVFLHKIDKKMARNGALIKISTNYELFYPYIIAASAQLVVISLWQTIAHPQRAVGSLGQGFACPQKPVWSLRQAFARPQNLVGDL